MAEMARQALPGGQVCEEIFVVPAQPFPRGRRQAWTPRQALLFAADGLLKLAEPEPPDQADEATWVAAEDILLLRLTLILLYGRLEIWSWQGDRAARIELEYNTVKHHWLAPPLRRLIRKTWRGNPAVGAGAGEAASLAGLESLSYSFHSGLRLEALQPEERLLGCVYQPEIHETRLGFVRRRAAPETALALTDQQVILLQQDMTRRTRHDWVFTFCPWRRVARLEQAAFRAWQKMTIRVRPEAAQQRLEAVFEPDQAAACCALWTKAAIGLPD